MACVIGFIAFCMLVTPVAANLQVVPSSAQVGKTAGVPSNVTLQIRNVAAYDYVNVSFADNPYISFPRIPVLAAGTALNVTASITANTAASETLRVRGFYQANVGPTRQTHSVTVVPFSSSPCDFTITEGDTVEWRSQVLSDITLIDAANGLPVDGATIQNNKTFSRTFPVATSFRYYFSISGFQFPETCTITVLDDTGYVNDPQKDGLFLLNLSIQFTPTTVSVSVPIVNYSLNFFETQDGVLTITNTGSNDAKAVRLSGEWFHFSVSNFDLAPGQTRAVSYTITPIVTRTNQTNQSYTRDIVVDGNFNTVRIPINVFIPFAAIGENATDIAQLKDLLGNFCLQFPRSQFCDPDPQVIYQGVNGTGGSQEFNVSVTQEQWRTFLLSSLEEKELRKTESNFLREKLDGIDGRNNETTGRIAGIEAQLNALTVEQTERAENLTLTIGIIGGFVVVASLTALILYYRGRLQAGGLKQW